MIQTHLTVDGGEQWLSWAYGRVRALRALDLPFMTKRYVMGDGSTVTVRLTPEATYIELKGTTGGYVCLPHANAFPQGDKSDAQGNPMVPEAVTTLKKTSDAPIEYDAKVKQHKKVETGTNDWRGKVNDKDAILTYSAHNKRYRMFEGIPDPQPGVWYQGKKIPTRLFRGGVGADFPVLGAAIAESPNGTPVFVIFVPDWTQGDFKHGAVYFKTIGGTDWLLAGNFDLDASHALVGGAPTGFTDPVYFSPDGKQFVGVIRAPHLRHRGRKITGSINLRDNPGTGPPVTATASFVVDPEDEYPSTNEANYDPPAAYPPEKVTLSSGTFRTDTYTPSNHSWQVNEWSMYMYSAPASGSGGSATTTEYSFVVAYDYAPDGTVRELLAEVSRKTSGKITVSGTQVYAGSFGDQYLTNETTGSGVEYGDFGAYRVVVTGSQWPEDYIQSAVFPAMEAAHSVTSYSEYTDLSYITLSVGVELIELPGSDIATVNSNTERWSPSAGFYSSASSASHSYVDVVTLLNHIDMRDMSYVVSALEQSTKSPALDADYSNRFYTKIKAFDRTLSSDLDIFTSKRLVPPHKASSADLTIHWSVFGARVSAGAYASRKDREYLLSVSAKKVWDDLKDIRDVRTPPPMPTLVKSLTLAPGKSLAETNKLFTIGDQPGFAINPITIF